MLDIITRWTTLPNTHPFLVHFPIALLPMSLLLEVMGLIRARPWWASKAAAFLLVVAAVLTFAAHEAGEDAADGLINVSLAAQEQMGLHHDAAEWAMRLTILAALLRIAVALHGRSTRSWNRAERGLAALVTALAVVAVLWAADLGGQLVYRHGLGVQPVERAATPPASMGDETDVGEVPAEDATDPEAGAEDDGVSRKN